MSSSPDATYVAMSRGRRKKKSTSFSGSCTTSSRAACAAGYPASRSMSRAGSDSWPLLGTATLSIGSSSREWRTGQVAGSGAGRDVPDAHRLEMPVDVGERDTGGQHQRLRVVQQLGDLLGRPLLRPRARPPSRPRPPPRRPSCRRRARRRTGGTRCRRPGRRRPPWPTARPRAPRTSSRRHPRGRPHGAGGRWPGRPRPPRSPCPPSCRAGPRGPAPGRRRRT